MKDASFVTAQRAAHQDARKAMGRSYNYFLYVLVFMRSLHRHVREAYMIDCI